MPVSPDLTGALKKVVLTLEDDLRVRIASQPEVDTAWRGLHAQAVDRERTAMSWQAWRDDRVTQAAVAWVLTSVFVRFCEDNRLLRPVWIAGPGERRQEALDAELQYFRQNPEHTDREWLLQSIEHLAALRATRDLVGSHSPLWTVSPSGQAVKGLLSFWREIRDDGSLVWDFTDQDLSTRFLGDLYQDLSDYAKKTFALLQTPEFVEEFILDHTMEPALAERPLEGFRMIDPTCGSGHFLLGAFARLNDRWAAHAPGLEPRARIQKALDAVHGVDLNPFAVAIARFRLMVAALQACGEYSLEDAPGFALQLAAGDSLLHGGHQLEMRFDGFDADAQLSGFAYDTEDLTRLREILTPGAYDVVVGNPPYITVSDRNLAKAYRSLYKTCHREFALTVPFMERFFDLAVPASVDQAAGWTGQITSNSFMTREFGAPLIEKFLAIKDLRLLVDTSVAHIPGHGTPTLILVGRNSRPTGSTLRSVLGIRREPGRPSSGDDSVVWRSIVDHIGERDYEDRWISVVDLPRTYLAVHPWSLKGGGALELRKVLESTPQNLSDRVQAVGYMLITGLDEAFIIDSKSAERHRLAHCRPIVLGDSVRDYRAIAEEVVVFPYDSDLKRLPETALSDELKFLWPYRRSLQLRKRFGTPVEQIQGFKWFEFRELYRERLSDSPTIAFSEVATGNHFAIAPKHTLFKHSSPVIKLPQGSTRTLPLLGVLNSSVTAFWLRQVCYDKGAGGISEGAKDEAWERFHAFNASNVARIPLPQDMGGQKAHQMSQEVEHLDTIYAELDRLAEGPSFNWDQCREQMLASRARLASLQEELDWDTYRSYGLIDEDLTYGSEPPRLSLGERAFEFALARRVAAGDERTAWFSRHDSEPLLEIPQDWPQDYQALVQRRLDAIESNRFIRLLEKPEYKRRWATEPWEKRVERALRGWLFERLEDRRFWFDASGRPVARSVGQLADEVSRDADLVSVLELWSGRRDQSVIASLSALLDSESVPFLAAYRLKDSGLRKREAWEHTWDLQRREDAGEAMGDVPVPPKYTSADFRKPSWWQHRGKLDVPKERFIVYPGAGREIDPTRVLGWAGWDHAQQALALAALIQDRETEGWDDERLTPLIAGLAELQPWVRQWHDETDPTFGVNLADYLEEQLRSRASQVARTLDELHAWRPEPSTRGRKPRA